MESLFAIELMILHFTPLPLQPFVFSVIFDLSGGF